MAEAEAVRNVPCVCPVCSNYFLICGCTGAEPEGCTFNCSTCGLLLIMREGKVLDFHKFLHALNIDWPEDGAGTTSIEIKEC